MTIDLSGGLPPSADRVLAQHPSQRDVRQGVSMWISDDAGRFGFPRMGVEAIGSDWDRRMIQANIAFPDGRVLIGSQVGEAHPDRGTEYCGAPERHEYELYLAVENIDHTRTKVRSPQTNGVVERFQKTVLNEFYRVAFRRKIYSSIEQLQAELDAWLREYNEVRPHQGKWCYGKTPLQIFRDALPLAREKLLPHEASALGQP